MNLQLCSLEKLAGRLALLASRSIGPKKLVLYTAGAGRTYSKLLFWESQFSEIIYNSYQQYKPQKDRLEQSYVVKTHFHALRAQGAHIENYYFGKVNFPRLSTIIFAIQPSRRLLRGALCSKKHIFAHCGRAASAKRNSPMIRSFL